jgi:hypothetical protein
LRAPHVAHSNRPELYTLYMRVRNILKSYRAYYTAVRVLVVRYMKYGFFGEAVVGE